MSTSLTLVCIVIAAAALLAGFAKGSLASAVGSLVTPLLALVLPAPLAIGLTLPLFIIGDMFAVIVRWRTWDGPLVLRCLPGMIAGIVMGSLLLGYLPAPIIARFLGVGAIFYALYRMNGWRGGNSSGNSGNSVPEQPERKSFPFWQTPFFSTLSAFASTIANAGGPVYTIFLLMRNETPKAFLGTTALFFALLNLSKLPSFFSIGILRSDTVMLIAWALPIVPFGVWTGKLLDPHISLKWFERIIVGLLSIVGVYLLFK